MRHDRHDPEIRKRIDNLRRQVEQQQQRSEQVKRATDDLARNAAHTRAIAAEIRRTNHLAEAVRQSFQREGLIDILRRKVQQWSS